MFSIRNRLLPKSAGAVAAAIQLCPQQSEIVLHARLRVLSRNSPSTPSAMNRACQFQTTGFALPDRRKISAVPQPSAAARMIWARLWRAAIRDNRLKPTAIRSCDVHHNSCSHSESFGLLRAIWESSV
jgi:hypothetical protein